MWHILLNILKTVTVKIILIGQWKKIRMTNRKMMKKKKYKINKLLKVFKDSWLLKIRIKKRIKDNKMV
jgi:hypothetical protein